MKPKTIPAAKFKAECLALLDEVAASRTEVVVTKRGQPVARLVPLARRASVKARARITGDLLEPGDGEWLE